RFAHVGGRAHAPATAAVGRIAGEVGAPEAAGRRLAGPLPRRTRVPRRTASAARPRAHAGAGLTGRAGRTDLAAGPAVRRVAVQVSAPRAAGRQRTGPVASRARGGAPGPARAGHRHARAHLAVRTGRAGAPAPAAVGGIVHEGGADHTAGR